MNVRNLSSTQRKGYHIKKSTRRNLIASAFLLWLNKKHEILFLTLTMPRKVRKGERLNPCLHRYITNLKKNYGLKSYIWTRENQKNGRPHYHLLLDIPYASIKKLNDAWCSAIDCYAPNAARLPVGHKAIINDMEKTCKYITKYITKDEKTYYPERCYSISKDTKAEPIRLSEYDLYEIGEAQGKNMKFRYYDHCTTVKIWDFFKNSDFFIEFLGNKTENDYILCDEMDGNTLIERLTTEKMGGNHTRVPSFLQLDLFNTS